MERISTEKLPPIFKMSVLWNILPYYGHIHRWRRLLEKINTETKEIWDQNREQLMYVGRDFKRDIELDKLKIYYLRPSRSWLDLFLLSLSDYFHTYGAVFSTLIGNLREDEVIIIDSHDDIFKAYQIRYWSKNRISDILPAIKCSSFKSKTKIFKTSEKNEIGCFNYDQNRAKSIVIENTGEELSINLVYGNTWKIGPWSFFVGRQFNFFNKLQERYKLWEIDECIWKPKKIRIWESYLKNLKSTIDKLKWISNKIDVKIGMYIYSEYYNRSFSNYDTIIFNNLAGWTSDSTNFIFKGDTLAVVSKGNYYNFRLDQRTKESKDSYISGRI